MKTLLYIVLYSIFLIVVIISLFEVYKFVLGLFPSTVEVLLAVGIPFVLFIYTLVDQVKKWRRKKNK